MPNILRRAIYAALYIAVLAASPAAHAKMTSEKAVPLVPSDSKVIHIYQGNGHAAVIYQYHIEFYDVVLSDVLKVVPTSDNQYGPIGPVLPFRGSAEAPLGDMKLVKTMTFRRHLDFKPTAWKPSNYFWACTDFNGYSPLNGEEMKEATQIRGWENKSAQIANFCGELSFSGDIIYRLPIKQHYPDTVIDLRGVSHDLKRAFLILGRMTEGEGPDGEESVINPIQTIIWEAPHKLYRINIEGKSDAEVLAIWKRHGL